MFASRWFQKNPDQHRKLKLALFSNPIGSEQRKGDKQGQEEKKT